MILADTSAWVEFDRATGTPIDHSLTEMIRSGGTELACTEPVLMEVLAGARDGRRHDELRRLLVSFAWLPADPAADFEGAAKIYRACRDVGLTPSGLIDCMIATIAIRTGACLLTADRDFTAMATIVPLRLAETA
ncbi:MAG: PIN domain nuclease [Acidimicrobiia bacterium]|nr:PIN domain nuclease [Acidimicrobiia bacterium]MDX2468216.1 PIN domain nuclease [Acidimicrobiia bacterium]